MIIRPWDGEISLSGRVSERYLLANFLRQISFVEINKVKRLNDSAFIVWCIWKNRGVCMKKVAVLLAPGFEEAEAIVTIDILRRLQIEVETLACAESRAVVSYHDVPMVTDSTLAARQTDLYDAVVLPGGPQGSVNLAASKAVIQFIARHDEAGKLICPVCSAAARVLGGNGLLKGRRYVCSGDLWQNVTDGEYIEICDRKEAIAYAIDNGRPGDIIVLAGKGHEDYQEIKGVKYHMDERELVADIIKEMSEKSK